MIRLIKKLFTFAVILAFVCSFSYLVVLPRIFPLQYQDLVEKYATMYHLEKSLVNGIIFSESHFDPNAVSSADAVGLMQVTNENAWWIAEQMDLDVASIDLKDPDTNIKIGCWYLNWLLEKFDGITETALAGYNAGHGNVVRWLSDDEMSKDGITLEEIPFKETKSYVKKVQLAQKIYCHVYRQ